MSRPLALRVSACVGAAVLLSLAYHSVAAAAAIAVIGAAIAAVGALAAQPGPAPALVPVRVKRPRQHRH